VIVTDDAVNSPQISNLTGNATAPVVKLSSTHLFYGAHLLGSTSSAQIVTVTNQGSAPLRINAISASGSYTESDTCTGQVIPVSSSCSVNVSFVPSITGTISGVLTIYDNASNSPQLALLSGSGVLPLMLSPLNLAFGTIAVGNTSAAQVVTFTNNLSTAISFSYRTSGSYTAAPGGTTPCGSSLAAGSNCTVQLTFSPTTNGIINGAVSVTNSSAYSPLVSNLFGSGSGGTAGTLSFSTNPLTFSPVLVGNTSWAKGVTVTNTGATSIKISSVTPSANYSVTGCGGVTLASGASCKIFVKFSPSVPGQITGAITFVDNASVSQQSLNLSGTGIPPVTFSPSTLTFAAQNVGTTSAVQIVTLVNHQSSTLSIASIDASGDYSAAGGGGNPCGSTVPASGSCTIAVRFSPSVAGTISGAVTVTHSASYSPQTVGLTGIGQ
jgi:hypothetical protein